MNILLINHYAGSPAHGMEFRPYFMAREWVRMGHRVEIVACSYSHVRARQPQVGPQAEQVDVIDDITYRWLRGNAYRGNGVGRLLNIATFLARLWVRAGRMVREFQPDLVIASSTYPMDTWVARHIARRARCRWIYEVHDLWPLSLIELSGMSPWHPFALLCAWAERRAYRRADAVVSMLPKVHAHMAARGLDLQRLRIVPNGVALQAWEDPPQALREDIQQTLQVARGKGHRVIGYAGSMGLPNALDTLLDAAALMRDEPITFVLVGDGHEKDRLQRRVREEQLANIHFLAPIPKAQIPSLLQAVDVAYIGWQRVPLYRFGIAPNKLMDYMMAGCPVLHSVEAGNDPVAESGCGLTVPPEDPQAVMAGLLHLLNLTEAQRKTMGDAGRAFVRAHHAYDVLARKFLDNQQVHTP
jgi:glycosyltransferase involved in cell wall biosynthesis